MLFNTWAVAPLASQLVSAQPQRSVHAQQQQHKQQQQPQSVSQSVNQLDSYHADQANFSKNPKQNPAGNAKSLCSFNSSNCRDNCNCNYNCNCHCNCNCHWLTVQSRTSCKRVKVVFCQFRKHTNKQIQKRNTHKVPQVTQINDKSNNNNNNNSDSYKHVHSCLPFKTKLQLKDLRTRRKTQKKKPK